MTVDFNLENDPEILINCCYEDAEENCLNGTQIYTKITFSEPVSFLKSVFSSIIHRQKLKLRVSYNMSRL